jgi:hypothetical protein
MPAQLESIATAPRVAASEPGCLPPGFRLREFRVERVLGGGGFGVVYEATDLKLERRVAIKEYMPAMLATRADDYSVQVRSSTQLRATFGVGLRSFINEAKLLARFEHPALLKVYQFWLDRGTGYMVMPLHTAPTVKEWVRGLTEPPSEAWLRDFLLGTMEALELLHREQCLHRDVSPDNILVLDSARPLLLDFGAARRVIDDMAQQALTVMYKPGFAPIEQYAESVPMRQGPWTDVYSLCAVARFMITGRPPPAALARIIDDKVEPLSVVARGRFSPALLAALDAGLEVWPDRRPETIAALRDRFLGKGPSKPPVRPQRPEPEARSSAAVAADVRTTAAKSHPATGPSTTWAREFPPVATPLSSPRPRPQANPAAGWRSIRREDIQDQAVAFFGGLAISFCIAFTAIAAMRAATPTVPADRPLTVQMIRPVTIGSPMAVAARGEAAPVAAAMPAAPRAVAPERMPDDAPVASAPADAASSGAVPVRAVARVNPSFPAYATMNGIARGRVLTRLSLAPDGSVTQVEVMDANPPRVFDGAARVAALQWRFEPPGRPSQAWVSFYFRN